MVHLAILLHVAFGATTANSACKPFDGAEQIRVAEYLKKKYKLPASASVSLAHDSYVGGTCYHKLEFDVNNSKRTSKLALFLSPDLRFLARELLDITVDPVAEERRRQQDFANALKSGNYPSLGSKDAPVTITVFSDFQCPYCSRMAQMLRREIFPFEKRTTRIVFRHFPLPGHDWAQPAAETAACVQEQGDDYFWQIHDFLFDHQREFTIENIRQRVVGQAGQFRKFNTAQLQACMASKRTSAKVESDVAFGSQNGVSGTPTLFINGEHVGTASVAEQLRTLIREAASKSKR